jgi:hypothetical protein
LLKESNDHARLDDETPHKKREERQEPSFFFFLYKKNEEQALLEPSFFHLLLSNLCLLILSKHRTPPLLWYLSIICSWLELDQDKVLAKGVLDEYAGSWNCSSSLSHIMKHGNYCFNLDDNVTNKTAFGFSSIWIFSNEKQVWIQLWWLFPLEETWLLLLLLLLLLLFCVSWVLYAKSFI